jgi:glycogen operon protein
MAKALTACSRSRAKEDRMRTLGPGRSHPLGATVQPGGVNFSIYSKNSTGAELLLFDEPDATGPSEVLRLDPAHHRTGHYWHGFIPGLRSGQLYGYRLQGPHVPPRGLLFDPHKVLLDPYARAVAPGSRYSRLAAEMPGDNSDCCMKSVVVDPRAYDWEGDEPLRRPFSHTVIYEMHLAGFTRHPSSGVPAERRGTYAGLIDKIPYLQRLGVTAVELLPVFQFDEQDAPGGLTNYWGYSPVSFFAPHAAYSSRKDPLGPVDEFRDLVKTLHRAGIEVILDVVYNHTAEGGKAGPTLGFRGLENRAYYMLEDGGAKYADYSGCGNTLNANHAVVRRMILDSLHHWVQLMHVDGFRFDLASILSRDEWGVPLKSPPVLWEIDCDPVLAGTKLIAEAWDAAGLYQVGRFVGNFWKEWNGRFRDEVRGFWKGDPGTVRRVASRLWGSPDIYEQGEREPEQSVNFVTCHDGFTLNDLVSYNHKHNETNREDNRDGMNENHSWNCGVEGPTDDPEIEALRRRQIKNLLATTLLSIGTPMLLMGDEVRRTQHGNNNAYCQDNPTSWFDWTAPERHADLLGFVRELIRLRLDLVSSQFPEQQVTLSGFLRAARLQWHGIRLHQPDWANHSHSIAFTVRSPLNRRVIHGIFNAYWKALDFELPPVPDGPGGTWRRLVDTSLEPPEDVRLFDAAPAIREPSYRVPPRSMILLAAEA